MADAQKSGASDGSASPAKSSPALLISLVIVTIGLVGLSLYLNSEADAAEANLENAIDEYQQMVNLKKLIEKLKQGAPRGVAPGSAQGAPLQFLSQKARQAQIPADKFNVTRNQQVTTGAWTETPYTINLRAKKEEPIQREPVVDFLRLVEEQRPQIKSKNLSLTFQDDAFSAVTITFSAFEKAAAPARSPQ